MPFEIVCNDITKMKVDAIVNAANRTKERRRGCGAIFAAAGSHELQENVMASVGAKPDRRL